MNLNKIKATSKKRIGRGIGSGKGGHTSSRGAKGDKARGKTGILFEGTKAKKSLYKRLPLLPGKGKQTPKVQAVEITLTSLLNFKNEKEINLETLLKAGLIKKGEKVKVLGSQKIDQSLIVNLPVSKGAKNSIEQAGGQVVNSDKIS